MSEHTAELVLEYFTIDKCMMNEITTDFVPEPIILVYFYDVNHYLEMDVKTTFDDCEIAVLGSDISWDPMPENLWKARHFDSINRVVTIGYGLYSLDDSLLGL